MLLGENARRFYGIEGRLFVTEERDLERPASLPKKDDEFKKWWDKEADPRGSILAVK